MNKIFYPVYLFILVTVFLISGCGYNADNEVKTRTITDMAGEKVNVPVNVQHVAVGAALNEMVLLCGEPNKLVATADTIKNSFYSTVYPDIMKVPSGWTGNGNGVLNMETIIGAAPQVVFASPPTVSDQQKQILEKSGIAVVRVTMGSPQELISAVELIGDVLGSDASKKAKEFGDYFQHNMDYVQEKTKDAEKVRVFVARNDGSKGAVSSIGGSDIMTDYINIAGGINVVSDEAQSDVGKGVPTVQVDFEYLMKKQPDIILAASADTYNYIMDKSNGSQWQDLKAVKDGKVYLIPRGVYLWSVRSGEGALEPLQLAKIMHPDLFPDLDLAEETKKFYEKFYQYKLTDEQVQNIFKQVY